MKDIKRDLPEIIDIGVRRSGRTTRCADQAGLLSHPAWATTIEEMQEKIDFFFDIPKSFAAYPKEYLDRLKSYIISHDDGSMSVSRTYNLRCGVMTHRKNIFHTGIDPIT